tara:strand:+ start:11440 stop:12288 length:849 start_codon:yes stop_codon:yes gene_type:complete
MTENMSHLDHYPELLDASSAWTHDFLPDALKDKAILVTGAGDGLGATTAKTYASFGANVILLGKTRSKLEQVSDWITQHTQTSPVIVPCDLERLDEDTVSKLGDAIDGAFSRLDGIVHHASRLGPRVPLEHYPPEAWQQVMQINVNAVFMLNRGLFELLHRGPKAVVVHTSSSVGRKGRAYWGAYAASKFALEGLSQILADETEANGQIQVFSVNPGATRTAMRREAYPLEDPLSLPLPEAHMELFLLLMSSLGDSPVLTIPTGQQLDARTWQQDLQRVPQA